MALIVMAFSTIFAAAETVTRGNVTLQYEPMADGGIKVVNVWNKSDKRIVVMIDGRSLTVKANSSAQPNQTARRTVRFDYATSSGALLWRYVEPQRQKQKEEPAVAVPESPAVEQRERPKAEPGRPAPQATPGPATERRADSGSGSLFYVDRLNHDSFYGQDAVNSFVEQMNSLYDGLASAKDKKQFIIDNDIREILERSRQEIEEKKAGIPVFAKNLVGATGMNADARASTLGLIVETLNNRLRSREEAYVRLRTLVDSTGENAGQAQDADRNILNYVIVGMLMLLVVIAVWIVVRHKNRRRSRAVADASPVPQASRTSAADTQAIVVCRRTTSILKRQCIDDVVDNPDYLMIDSSEFTQNSAVRKIYIKNTCIKGIYNLYADDLRNADNPKEDGCMVLGRWVYDVDSHTYDISMEEVILPGDDAVFKEYELNFGGKIKLRIAEKLRKLRRETNLQYDLVCWIHSHPGLGVFFSNSDDNVQMQLKHSQHPNFLIAFVIDILTSSQEMGIFTFRQDGTMNSRGDLLKMYSLEEMYKWALQSERNSFSPENYFNLLGNARLKIPACAGVELNNSAVIDLSQIVVEPTTGIVGWAIGTAIDHNGSREFVVSGIVRNPDRPAAGVIGCLVSATYMSLPTIQRQVVDECRNLSFVLVYSSRQMTLTAIPVVNGELLTNENFYGDETIDNLKIWTRRKR